MMYTAEDAGRIVGSRPDGIAGSVGTLFDKLDIAVPALRLDQRANRQRLLATVSWKVARKS